MWNRELAIVDIETTGLTARRHRVIEVAVLKVKDGELVETYSTLIDPEVPISPFIEELTGITDKELRYAPTFGAIRRELFRLLDGALFVAHNATFDYGFLKEEFRRVEMDFSANCLCTVRLSRRLFPDHRGHSLDAVMGRFGLTCADRHRAMGDAMVVWDFLKCLETRVQDEDLGLAVEGATKKPAAPRTNHCPTI
jgi:DNA polymerase-3 subunit epsilon